MNEIDSSQMLSQLRSMAALAQGQNGESNSVEKSTDFSALLGNAVDKVNQMQKTGGAMTKAFDAGDPSVSLAETMIARQKASIAFEAMKQIRNKMVSAYQDIMSMPI
ncbi:MAG TPA: flagellar hook-basal body complex protein FliE [Gammaproteobacteria bacterium]|nr:flagellar hook-basal body complex protein FliE [Gammaproteobacteria bacterium]